MASTHIGVERELLKHPAFRNLNGTAKAVLFDFMMRRKVDKKKSHRNGTEYIVSNNGELVYTYAEAERNGIPRSSFMRAIDDLVEAGFIDIAHAGSGGRKGDVTLYAISCRWHHHGTDRWEPTTRPKDTRQGRGFQPGHKAWKSAIMGIKSGNPTITINGNRKS